MPAGVFVARRRRRARRRRSLDRPGALPPLQRARSTSARVGADAARAPRRRGHARLAALDRRRLLPASSRPSSGSCCSSSSLAGFLADRAQARSASRGRRCGAIALALVADRARLHPARHRHGARLRAPRSRPCSSSPARAGCTSAVLGVVAAARRARACSGGCRRPASTVLKPYQAERLTGFTHPDSDPSGATYNVNQSITAVGAGGAARARRRRARRRRASTTCPSTRPTSRSPRSPSSAASSARRSCCCSTCSSSGAGCKIVAGRARPVLGDRRRRDRVRVPLPDLRQRRDDDRASRRSPASRCRSSRVGGSSMIANLLAIGRPAGDPRPRPRRTAARW